MTTNTHHRREESWPKLIGFGIAVFVMMIFALWAAVELAALIEG